MTQSKIVAKNENDFELKIRFMRYLWSTGHFVRRNVELPNLDANRPGKTYTDIDVVGIKFDKLFYPSIVVADCKTGKTGKYERFFWLSGVMNYFQSNQAFYIRNKINETEYSEISEKLGIRPLSLTQIENLEKTYNIDPADYYGPFSQDQKKVYEAFMKLRKQKGLVSEYLSSRFWGSPPNEQIVNLMVCFRDINNLSDMDEKSKNFLLISTLSLLSIALLNFNRNILYIPNKGKENYIKESLLGGRTSTKEKEMLLNGFYDFMMQEIQKKYKKKHPLSRKAFIDGLVPPYAKYLYELIIRMQNNPINSVEMPRILDYIGYNIILGGKERKLEELLCNKNLVDKRRSLRPIYDLLTYIERSTPFDTTNLETTLKEELKKLEGD